MHYVVYGGDAASNDLPPPSGCRLLADGDMIVLEGPWVPGRTALAYAPDDAALGGFRGAAAPAKAYAVEGMIEPGPGQAFAIAAHRMLDPDGFRPYAQAIPDLLHSFGVRSLARAGKVTPLAGDFAPERAVVLEFPSVEATIDFYTSDVYAPLLRLRWRTTDPRFVVLARSGPIVAALRAKAEAYVKAQRALQP